MPAAQRLENWNRKYSPNRNLLNELLLKDVQPAVSAVNGIVYDEKNEKLDFLAF